MPHQLEPDTLETLGKFNFGGALRSPHFTAHPKIDPATGDPVFYGYEVNGLASSDAAICVASRDGRLLREDWFKLPYPALVHDFAITENYIAFPIMPTLSDLERMKAGGDHWCRNPLLPTLVGVMPRNGSTDDIRYFSGPARWSFHTMNAFNSIGRIDHGTGKVYLCYVGDDCQLQEPTFVPDGEKGAEGDGYLVAIVNHPKENRGDLVIADARTLSAGPVAVVRLPLLMRLAFPGTWVGEAALQRARHAV